MTFLRVISQDCLHADHDIVFSYLRSVIQIRSPLTDLRSGFRIVCKTINLQNRPVI